MKWHYSDPTKASWPMTFGQLFSKLRKNSGMSLNAFCEKHGFAPSTLSRIETNKMRAPQSKAKLAKYCRAFKLKKGTPEWITFHDFAEGSNKCFEVRNINDAEVLASIPELVRAIDTTDLTLPHLKLLTKYARLIIKRVSEEWNPAA